MKYQVKVGLEFPCLVAEEKSIAVEVTVVQRPGDLHLSDMPRQSKGYLQIFSEHSFKVLLTMLAISVLASVLLGWFTGDFSVLKSIAERGRDLLALGIKLISDS